MIKGGFRMDINKLKELPYNELRDVYKQYLQRLNINKNTINTAYAEAFYLWRKGNEILFWDTVLSADFEHEARANLLKILAEHSTVNADSQVNSYLYHLRKFHSYINSGGTSERTNVDQVITEKKRTSEEPTIAIDIPSPTAEQVELYLREWDGLEDYRLQEDALDKLFLELCPNNTDIREVLLKAATLNAFYSTNIFSIYPVAKHILSLNIDARLDAGDATLVRDIQSVTINNKTRNFYSFATKYCSHHKPFDYPIYDSYVDKVLRYFKKRDNFSDFKNEELKDYVRFKKILIDFRDFYGLNKYNLKQIDRYIWLFGKEHFLKKYGKKKSGDQ